MNIPMLKAFVEGYQERLFDMECLAVQQGYWAGYYQSKKPKSVKVVLEKMDRDHKKIIKKAKNIPKPEVDVDRFLKLEERRKAFLARKHNKG